MVMPVMAIAGSMLGKKTVAPGPGTFPTNGALFSGLLVAVILIVGALTFFPALSLGPIAEHFVALMHRLAAFCGISVLTYALMSNHFHLLCEVPEWRELSDAELLARLEGLYGPDHRRAETLRPERPFRLPAGAGRGGEPGTPQTPLRTPCISKASR